MGVIDFIKDELIVKRKGYESWFTWLSRQLSWIGMQVWRLIIYRIINKKDWL